MATVLRRRGVVVSFDDPAGLGVLRDSEDGADYEFHCTAIADGTRTIDASVAVDFYVAPTHAGRLEAVGIVKL